MFSGFLPAVSADALTAMGAGPSVAPAHVGPARSGRARHDDQPDRGGLDELLRPVLPVAVDALLQRINTYLMRWAVTKYKRLRSYERFSLVVRAHRSRTRTVHALAVESEFAGLDEKSGVTGDCHAPFRGSPGVQFPRATRRIKPGVVQHSWQ